MLCQFQWKCHNDLENITSDAFTCGESVCNKHALTKTCEYGKLDTDVIDCLHVASESIHLCVIWDSSYRAAMQERKPSVCEFCKEEVSDDLYIIYIGK
jgi:hypothetical protein